MEIVVHRGRNIIAPENSLEGIEEIRNISHDLRIELDVTVTKDGVPVVFHDISLERRFGVKKTIFDFDYEELPNITQGFHVPSLQEVLSTFPKQKFLLDLRTDIHIDFFDESTLKPEDIAVANFSRLSAALNKVVNSRNTQNCRVLCGELHNLAAVEKIFPDCEVDVPERHTRSMLSYIDTHKEFKVAGRTPDRVYISISRINESMVEVLQSMNIKVVLCSSLPKFGTNALQSAQELRVDGLLSAGLPPEKIWAITGVNQQH